MNVHICNNCGSVESIDNNTATCKECGHNKFSFRADWRPIRKGVRWYGEDHSGGVRWWLLNRQDDSDMENVLLLLNAYTSYGGPGQFFAHDAYWITKGSHTLVRQRIGWDI